jgi:hypothetical protein
MSIVLTIDWGSVDDRALRERVLKSRSMRPTSGALRQRRFDL